MGLGRNRQRWKRQRRESPTYMLGLRKIGHRQADCWMKGKGKTGKAAGKTGIGKSGFAGNCVKCGKLGHRAETCWSKGKGEGGYKDGFKEDGKAKGKERI